MLLVTRKVITQSILLTYNLVMVRLKVTEYGHISLEYTGFPSSPTTRCGKLTSEFLRCEILSILLWRPGHNSIQCWFEIFRPSRNMRHALSKWTRSSDECIRVHMRAA